MLQNPCKTLGFKKNMVYKIPPWGEVNHIQPVAYFLSREKPNAGQNCFQTVTIFFNFFSTACFFDIISSMSRQVLESNFSTDPWWYFKELCFLKDIHLVFSITCRTPVKDAGFI